MLRQDLLRHTQNFALLRFVVRDIAADKIIRTAWLVRDTRGHQASRAALSGRDLSAMLAQQTSNDCFQRLFGIFGIYAITEDFCDGIAHFPQQSDGLLFGLAARAKLHE